MTAERDTSAGLHLSGVDAGYGDARIIADVSFDVDRGEFLGLVGPNGAGKSTLLKAVTGRATVTGGEIAVCGDSWAELDARARARRVGVVPQALPEPFSFSAREFVEMGRYPYLGRFERLGSADRAAADRAMELTDTIDSAGKPVDTLSGGDLQRLTLAQALAQDPEVLLLDEPTSHLDLNHQLQVLDLVRSRLDDGLAVLGVFHDIGLAARYADRIAVISRGRLRGIGPPSDVITPDVVREVFGVRAVVGSDPVTGTVTVTPILRDTVSVIRGARRVFVVGGSGAAAGIMRDLVEEGLEVVAGALNEGDVDQAVAEALGIEHIKLPPFGEMDTATESSVARLADLAHVSVVAPVPFGRANIGNLRAVATATAPVILVAGDEPTADFTGGEATRAFGELRAGGAIVVATTRDVVATVAGIGGSG
jgi:iron complex transport system ATP-binding protein